MADIKVRFEVNPNAESELLGDVNNVNAELSNVSVKTNSSNVFQNIPTSESNGINALSFGQDLVFDENGCLDNEDLKGGVLDSEQNPTEFVWGVVPESKQYSVELTFTNASDLKDIVVYGDRASNQFPTRAIIDGTTEIFSDDYRWAINLQSESNTHTIEFTHWNRANYNASLTFISVMMEYFEVDKRNGLKSVEILSQSTGQPKEIFYGVVPSTGNLKIIDVDGEISDMVKDGTINNSNLKIEIEANGKDIQKNISIDTTYSDSDKTLSMETSDKLVSWNNIIIPQYKNLRASYENTEFYHPSLYDTLYRILKYAKYEDSEIDSMLMNEIEYDVGYSSITQTKNYKVATIKEYLSEIKHLTFEYYNSDSLFNIVENICKIAQLQVYEDNSGQIQFKDARPKMNAINLPSVIKIPPKFQTAKFKNDFVPKNVYSNFSCVFNDFEFSEFSRVFSYSGQANNISSYFTSGCNNLSNHYYYIAFLLDVSFADLLSFDNLLSSYEPPIQARFILSNSNTDGLNISEFNHSDISKESWTTLLTTDRVSRVTILDKYTNQNSYSMVFQLWTNVSGQGIEQIDFLDIYGVSVKFKDNQFLKNNNNDIYNYPKNEFLNRDIARDYMFTNENVTYNSYKQMLDVISDNIIEDYSHGIKTATTTVVCGDYYSTNGNLIKQWSNGEILEIGDIVRVDKDNNGTNMIKYADGRDMYFQVTGRRFRYEGVPLTDLELQEVKY